MWWRPPKPPGFPLHYRWDIFHLCAGQRSVGCALSSSVLRWFRERENIETFPRFGLARLVSAWLGGWPSVDCWLGGGEAASEVKPSYNFLRRRGLVWNLDNCSALLKQFLKGWERFVISLIFNVPRDLSPLPLFVILRSNLVFYTIIFFTVLILFSLFYSRDNLLNIGIRILSFEFNYFISMFWGKKCPGIENPTFQPYPPTFLPS